MDRREFLTNCMSIPLVDQIIQDHKDKGTKELQGGLIYAMYRIYKTLDLRTCLYLPFSYSKQGTWYSTKKIAFLWACPTYAILQWDEDFGDVLEQFKFIRWNRLVYSEIPELFNFYGSMVPFFDLIRPELPDHFFTKIEPD